MKTFENFAAQGDFIIMKIDDLPDDAIEIGAENGEHVIAHSETGHNHIILETPTVKMYRLPESIYEAFLVVNESADIEHKRSYDTHETLRVAPGTYQIKRQREYTAEGFRRAQD